METKEKMGKGNPESHVKKSHEMMKKSAESLEELAKKKAASEDKKKDVKTPER